MLDLSINCCNLLNLSGTIHSDIKIDNVQSIWDTFRTFCKELSRAAFSYNSLHVQCIYWFATFMCYNYDLDFHSCSAILVKARSQTSHWHCSSSSSERERGRGERETLPSPCNPTLSDKCMWTCFGWN